MELGAELGCRTVKERKFIVPIPSDSASHPCEMCGMLMTQSVYVLRIILATCWRPASSGLLWRCYSSVLSRGIQLKRIASLSAQNLFLLENSALKFD